MLILLSETDDSLLYEYHACRIVVSKDKFFHLCVIAFNEGLSRPPNEEELKCIIDFFLHRNGKKLSYIKKKMFTDKAVHIWEDTDFTRKVLGI